VNDYQWEQETLKGFNLPLAHKVLDQARHEEALEDYTFDMHTWVSGMDRERQRDSLGRFTSVKVCKTAACLAGTGFLLDPDTTVKLNKWGDSTFYDAQGRDIDEVYGGESLESEVRYAAQLFGMTVADASHMFCSSTHINDHAKALDTFEDLIKQAESVQYSA
jgi:hypothetical protein